MIKCLVWDLDDTLWQGTLSEDEQVELRPNIKETLRKLDERGILQSIASRNESKRTRKKLVEFEIDHYFLFPQFSGASKVASIQRIAREMNIGMDTIAFIDDNPYERYEVSVYLPEVRIYTADAANSLILLPEFQYSLSHTGGERRRHMKLRMESQREEKSFNGSREAFFRSCEMELTLRRPREEDASRMAELVSRTTQFNNRVQMISPTTIQSYVQGEENHELYVGQFKDRFGDHGLVAMTMIQLCDVTAEITLFCMSCRMEGRGIGSAFLGSILYRLYKDNPILREVIFRYRPHKRNRPLLLLLQSLGFSKDNGSADEWIFKMELPCAYEGSPWVSLRMEGEEVE